MALPRSNAFQCDLAHSTEVWTQNCDSIWLGEHRVIAGVSVYLLENYKPNRLML